MYKYNILRSENEKLKILEKRAEYRESKRLLENESEKVVEREILMKMIF